uniref:Murine leukemia virus integrase C-terminal domain-containing protein n=1 Tax=Molossus molossus TaxID=27622 RepID=A0A7J8HBZ3_MOLMO|nr:hypothetical protein HJG59_011145 [Molossus molossus]
MSNGTRYAEAAVVTQDKSLQVLQLIQWRNHQIIRDSLPKPSLPGDSDLHRVQPRDWIWVKKIQPASLEPRWTGSLPVILATQKALKIAGCRFWSHHFQARGPPRRQRSQITYSPRRDLVRLRYQTDSLY